MNGDTMKKYELQPTDLTTPNGKPFFRVVALRNFGEVLKGDKGGYVESEDNLSNKGNCWVSNNARVFENARVFGNSLVYGEAWVFGNSLVFGEAWVFGDSRVFGGAQVFGDSWVYGGARVSGTARVSGKAWAYDTTKRTDGLVSLAQTDTCTHYGIDSGGTDYYGTSNPSQEADWNYAYCPKCGEKL